MKISNYVLTIIISLGIGVVLGGILLQPAIAEDKTQDFWMEGLLNKLISESKDERLIAWNSIYNEYQTVGDRLMEIAAQKQEDKKGDRGPHDDSRTLAIELLGQLHIVKAIPFLLDNINIVGFYSRKNYAGAAGEGMAPCMEAIDDMDLPMSSIVISYLENASPLTDELCTTFAHFLIGLHFGPREMKNMWSIKPFGLTMSYYKLQIDSASERVKKMINQTKPNPNLQKLLAKIEQLEKALEALKEQKEK